MEQTTITIWVHVQSLTNLLKIIYALDNVIPVEITNSPYYQDIVKSLKYDIVPISNKDYVVINIPVRVFLAIRIMTQ